VDVNMSWHPQADWRPHAIRSVTADLAVLMDALSDLDPRSPEAQALFPQFDRLLAEKDALVHG
jgi:hypothetical protein